MRRADLRSANSALPSSIPQASDSPRVPVTRPSGDHPTAPLPLAGSRPAPRKLPSATFERFRLFEHLSSEDMRMLESWEWDPWDYSREQLVAAVMQMFINLGMLDGDRLLDPDTLWSFLEEVSTRYNDVPYHNWKHAADVTHK